MYIRNRSSSRSRFLTVVCVTGLVLALVLVGAVALAAGPEASQTPVTIAVTAQPQADGTVMVFAKAAKVGAGVLSNQTIDFYVKTTFFGERPMRIASGTTDTGGSVAIKYQPTWSGRHQFLAVFAGDAALAEAEGAATVELKTSGLHYHSAPPDLKQLRATAGMSALGATVTVWLVLLGVLLRVVWSVSRKEVIHVSEPGTAAEGSSAQ